MKPRDKVLLFLPVRRNIFLCRRYPHTEKIEAFVELQICLKSSKNTGENNFFGRERSSIKLLGSRLISGNSQENFGPVVMYVTSANSKIRNIVSFTFFHEHSLQWYSVAQRARHPGDTSRHSIKTCQYISRAKSSKLWWNLSKTQARRE